MPLLLSLAFIVTAASAAGKDHKLEAKAEADRASVLYRLGKFPEALDAFSHAYELFQAPGLLFNLGQCHRQLAHHRQAVFFFSEYLREVPAAPNREQVDGLLADERAQEKVEDASRPHAVVTPQVANSTSPPGLVGPPELVVHEPVIRTWWFWTAVGGGTAIVAAAIITGVVLAQPHTTTNVGTLGILDRQ